MRFLVIIFALLFTQFAQATYIPPCRLQVGGYCFSQTEVTNLKILYGRVTTSGRATTLRLANGTAGYQVPGGNTLRVKVVQTICDVTTCQVGLGYGDTDVGVNSASAPTTPIYVGGDSTPINVSATNMQYQGGYMDFGGVADKYMFMVATGSSVSVIVYAVLE